MNFSIVSKILFNLFSNRLLTEWPGESRPAQLLCDRQQTKSFKSLAFYNIHNLFIITLFFHYHIIKCIFWSYMIHRSLSLSHSCPFRQGARKLGVKVNIVSHNLGTEIRNELRWGGSRKSGQKCSLVYPTLFGPACQLGFNVVIFFMASFPIWFDVQDLRGHNACARGCEETEEEVKWINSQRNQHSNCPGEADIRLKTEYQMISSE